MHTFIYVDGAGLSGLIQGSDGNFYGTTSHGGANATVTSGGTIFEITTNGTLTTLYSFSGPDGSTPQGALAQGTDGSFYGTTTYGGTQWTAGSTSSGYGTIFRITITPDVPVIQTVTQTNGIIAFTWNAVIGSGYQVQCNTNLTSTNWLDLGSAITATSTNVSAFDFITNQQCFYRIQLLQ